jgi:hypothetical protein
MPSFDQDVKPLFREKDRREMTFVFDLWSHEDVKTHAQNILDRIEDGTMPCDAPWPDEQIQVLRDWIAGGFEP